MSSGRLVARSDQPSFYVSSSVLSMPLPLLSWKIVATEIRRTARRGYQRDQTPCRSVEQQGCWLSVPEHGVAFQGPTTCR